MKSINVIFVLLVFFSLAAMGAVNLKNNQNYYQYPEGSYPEGSYPEGSYPEGSYPEGSYPEGSYPEGSYPEGSYPEGSYPEGSIEDFGCSIEYKESISCAEGLYRFDKNSDTGDLIYMLKKYYIMVFESEEVKNCSKNQGVSIECAEGMYKYVGASYPDNIDNKSRFSKPQIYQNTSKPEKFNTLSK